MLPSPRTLLAPLTLTFKSSSTSSSLVVKIRCACNLMPPRPSETGVRTRAGTLSASGVWRERGWVRIFACAGSSSSTNARHQKKESLGNFPSKKAVDDDQAMYSLLRPIMSYLVRSEQIRSDHVASNSVLFEDGGGRRAGG